MPRIYARAIPLAALLLAAPAVAHMDYPAECCNGKDCYPVACEALTEHRDDSVTWRQFTFTRDKVRPSHDRACHVCVFNGSAPLCAFVQQSS